MAPLTRVGPREINYSIDFQTAEDRSAFVNRLYDKAFQLGKMNDAPSAAGAAPYSLHLKKVDAIELPRIGAIELYLIKRATAHRGRYDGWGCFTRTKTVTPLQ